MRTKFNPFAISMTNQTIPIGSSTAQIAEEADAIAEKMLPFTYEARNMIALAMA